MSQTFNLEVITPEGVKFKGEAEALNLETLEGEVGILPGHCPYLALLSAGIMRIKFRLKTTFIVYGEGFLQFNRNRSTILTESAQNPEEIELDSANNIIAESQKNLSAFNYRTEAEQQALRKNLKLAKLKLKLAKLALS